MKSERIWVDDASGWGGYADAVFAPASEAELSELLRSAAAQAVPVTISGAGSGVAGGRVPLGGSVISLSRFRDLEVGAGYARAGAGVLLHELQRAASASGQFYPPDPTENLASIGGTIATNASGSRSFRYGATRRYVEALRVALADGSVIAVRRGEPAPFAVAAVPSPATTKNSTGFPLREGMDYLDLFVGSEGTLGVVIEARLRLLPAPGDLLAGVVFFASDAACLRTVELWRGIERLQMLEYMDAGSLDLLRSKFPEIPARARAALLVEQEMEDDGELDAWEQRIGGEDVLGEQSWFGTEAADRERFRVFRHALPEAVNELVRRNGATKMGTDFAVPLARNGEMMAFYRELLDREFPRAYVIFGHIGDAHVHVNLLPKNEPELTRARELVVAMARKAVELGGVVAAEHGLGKRKAHLLGIQYTPEQIEAMRDVKRRLDPLGLLGRGTLFPA